MPSSQKVQYFLIKRLDSDIDSIDPNLTHRFKERSTKISRVRLDCYFRGYSRVRYQIEVFLYAYQRVFQLLRAEKRRGSASNVDCFNSIESVSVHLHLFEESVQKIRNRRD